MRFHGWTFLLQTLNFLLLVWLLKRFLFKPVSQAMAKRQTEAARLLDAAEAAKKHADEDARVSATRRAEFAAERQAGLASARSEAEKQRDEILAAARLDIDAMTATARAALEREREAVTEHLLRLASDVAVRLAERLLHEAGMKLDAEPFLAQLSARLEHASPEELATLRSQLVPRATVTLAIAPTLDARRTTTWQSKLAHQLGDDVMLQVVSDPELLAGAELRLPRSVVGASLRDALVHAREELDGTAHAR